MTRWTTLLAALAAIACVAIGCAGGGETPVTPSAFIRITAPNGGEEWLPGTDQEITWVSQYIDGTVTIEYSTDEFVSDINLVAADEPNDGSFIWEDIPSDFSDSVHVRISWSNFPGVSDVSDTDFTIVGPWIEVLTPNGGEEWPVGSDEEITWASLGIPGTVYIEYSKDNFASDINPITVDEPNDGSFTWEDVPMDPSPTVRIRITATENPIVQDMSDSDFAIVVPSIEVLTPNGGEQWTTGTVQEITWDSQHINTVSLEYSTDNFVSDVNLITTDEPSDGSFLWDPVPYELSETVRVRVSWTDYPDVNDVSDDDFSIIDAGWARTWAGPDSEQSSGVVVGDSGNIYVTGHFYEEIDIDPGGGDLRTSNGELDVFLSKFDSGGSLQWARTWGGISFDTGNGLAIDGIGDVYVAGSFSHTVDFDPGDGADIHTSNGEEDIYLVKLDSLGNFNWARTWGGSGLDTGCDVTADGFGNVYTSGSFQQTVDFDPNNGHPQTSNGQQDVFLSKFDSSGNFVWVRTWGGTSIERGQGVAADSLGGIYTTGYFFSTMDFNPDGGDPHTPEGLSDVFLSKFDSSGNFEWARTWGGTLYDWSYEVAAGDTGRAYVTGYFSETVDFDPSGGDPHTSNGQYDAFLSRFGSSGNFEWARTWGGLLHDIGRGVTVDGSGNVYVTGDFVGTVDFNPTGGSPLTSNGHGDVFLSKFDTSGSHLWARGWGGSYGDTGLGVAVDWPGHVFVTGTFYDTVDFAPTDPPCNDDPDLHMHTCGGGVFLTRHLPDGCW